MADDRELVFTVTARVPLSRVMDDYIDSLTDGNTQTSNAYIESYAQGLIDDMTTDMTIGGVGVEATWKLEPSTTPEWER